MRKKFYFFKKKIEKIQQMGDYSFSLLKSEENEVQIFLCHGGIKEYTITLYHDPQKKPVCTCFDYERSIKNGIYCKHIIKLLYQLGREGELLSILLSEGENAT
ncbi:MAG: SWIM zinc finger domain-containing protein [Elusimicrobiota bacterium]